MNIGICLETTFCKIIIIKGIVTLYLSEFEKPFLWQRDKGKSKRHIFQNCVIEGTIDIYIIKINFGDIESKKGIFFAFLLLISIYTDVNKKRLIENVA